MSQSVRGIEITMISNAALDTTTTEYRVAEVAGVNLADIADTTTAFPLGVFQNKPKSGSAALIRIGGTSKVFADTAVTAGDILTLVGAGGGVKPVVATATVTTNLSILGIALETGVTQSFVEVALFPARGGRSGI